MEEQVMENVENVAEKVAETIAEAKPAVTLPTVPTTAPASNSGKFILTIGGFAGGVAVGAAIDHWVVPKIQEGWKRHKTKKALKKAQKAAAKAVAEAMATAANPTAKPAEPTAASVPTEGKVG